MGSEEEAGRVQLPSPSPIRSKWATQPPSRDVNSVSTFYLSSASEPQSSTMAARHSVHSQVALGLLLRSRVAVFSVSGGAAIILIFTIRALAYAANVAVLRGYGGMAWGRIDPKLDWRAAERWVVVREVEWGWVLEKRERRVGKGQESRRAG